MKYYVFTILLYVGPPERYRKQIKKQINPRADVSWDLSMEMSQGGQNEISNTIWCVWIPFMIYHLSS